MSDEQTDTHLVIFTPSGKRGRVASGTPVLQAARQLGVDLDSVCGGRGICSKCQVSPGVGSFPKHGVTVAADALSPFNKVEARYDEKRGLAPGRRLGCQAQIQGDVVIDVPPESQVHRQVVRKRAEARDIVLDPATRMLFVEVAEPDMHRPEGDFERLAAALAAQWQIEQVSVGLPVLARLQATLRAGKWQVTVALQRRTDGWKVVEIWPGYHETRICGLAVDIGSTTIAAHLCDLSTGEVLASQGLMNPQIRFGEDLMSRVSYAQLNPGGAGEMTHAVREALDKLIGALAEEAGVAREDIFEGVFVGNPVMHHLFLGIDPVELGWAPFALATSGPQRVPASELGLHMHPEARAAILPCIAGHVGADAAAVALSEAPEAQEELTLIIDVGTNAEIFLGNRDKVLACSSPTGPAFEGAQVSSGQRAAPGAIERVRIDPETRRAKVRVIGCELWSDEPGFAEAVGAGGVTGICGSGIIEALAEMRLAGVMDKRGIIGSAEVLGDVVFAEGRTWSYRLHVSGERVIAVTQNDVQQILFAKAALYAGARLLMDQLGVDHVERVVLAGAFGAHISPLHAMVLGMIPDCPLEKVSSAGNAAGTGARIALLNLSERRRIAEVVRKVEKVETAVEPRFQEHFVDAMRVPHENAPYPNLAAHAVLPDIRFETAGGGEDGGRRRRRRG
ncbi:ASKHA domain-containing protein [Paralimibaculum aggregatum]|uniref:ASKHA domain-containing protein n=1 Tax=Paralimibaculum aggregatum TaxID=3036245 RepID=A0ABQ6LPH1_9RHOB|nr:ASKHA domain-containing protein [Limibaculum sp. NKW23]GMG84431.1 ASKHA domain-containing protein [Limibaculum sp. NKW23]